MINARPINSTLWKYNLKVSKMWLYEHLYNFVSHLNSFFGSIKFTMEVEVDGEVAISGYMNYETHEWYSGTDSFQKGHLYESLSEESEISSSCTNVSALATLADRARKITDADRLQQDLNFLQDIFVQHGYTPGDINSIIYKKQGRTALQEEEEMIRGDLL